MYRCNISVRNLEIIGFSETIVSDPDLPEEMKSEFNKVILNEGKRLAKLINAPNQLLPTFETSEDFARPHIEKQGNEYHCFWWARSW